jgi:RNA polymerase sigma factor (TIGR02999 family)
MSDVTRILDAIEKGEPHAAEQLLPLVYAELRRLAAQKMALESPGHTLQPTALVHEAWLGLASDEKRQWNNRTHFFAAAAEAMRRILVDNARRKRTERHGGRQQRVEMPDIATAQSEDQIVAVDEALEKLAAQDPQKANLVKLRYFVGMTGQEAAEALGISIPTATRHWAYARAWLATEMKAQQ